MKVRASVLPLPQAVGFMARVTVDEVGCADLEHGRVAGIGTVVEGTVEPDQDPIAFLSRAGALVAIGFSDAEGLHSKRGFPAPGC